MKHFLPLLFALSALAQVPPNDPPVGPPPDPVCVPFIDNSAYCRVEYGKWYLTNWNKTSDLYLNGVYQSTEPAGNASIDFLPWPAKRNITVGIADSSHGISLDNIITNICSATVFHSTPDAAGIRDCVSAGCNVINISWFTTVQGQPATDLSNACYEATQAGVILVCSVPNVNQSIDDTVALPASLVMPLLIPVCSSTRQDALYAPTAIGSNVVAAPGRVIWTQAPDGSPAYGSGSSYAAPIVAGVVTWLLGQFEQTPTVIVQAIRQGCTPISSSVLGRVSIAGAVNALRPKVKLSVLGIDGAMYMVERSTDLVDWNYFTTTTANTPCDATPGFYRARIL